MFSLVRFPKSITETLSPRNGVTTDNIFFVAAHDPFFIAPATGPVDGIPAGSHLVAI